MVTTSVGPRVLGLLTEDGRNHFAELPDMTLDCPGSDPHPPARRQPPVGRAGGPALHLPTRR